MATPDVWHEAVRSFWAARDQQTQKQIASGIIDAGTRGAVTGGKHLDALTMSVAGLFAANASPGMRIQYGARVSLPGYYRRTKDWDLVVTYRGVLVAAIELKSQVGPSFGNNFNNRAEEAIGNAADIWRAYEVGLLGSVRPWLAFVMILEKVSGSTTPLSNSPALFAIDPAFNDTGYLDRYRVLLQRLVREKQYDAAVVAASEQGQGVFDEPLFELSFANLEAAVTARLSYIKALPSEAFGSGLS